MSLWKDWTQILSGVWAEALGETRAPISNTSRLAGYWRPAGSIESNDSDVLRLAGSRSARIGPEQGILDGSSIV